MARALSALRLEPQDAPAFEGLLRDELDKLDLHNCARYRLTLAQTESWLEADRPC